MGAVKSIENELKEIRRELEILKLIIEEGRTPEEATSLWETLNVMGVKLND